MSYSLAAVISEAEGFAAELERLADTWLNDADALDSVTDEHDETSGAFVAQLRECASQVLDLLGLIDTDGSASRQHYIETGRYIRFDEEV